MQAESNIANLELQNEMKDEVTCSICTNILDEPVCCQCAANFCKTCTSKLERCPSCQAETNFDGQTRIILKFLDKIKFKCPQSKCEEVCTQSVYQNHIMKCDKQKLNENQIEPILIAYKKLINKQNTENKNLKKDLIEKDELLKNSKSGNNNNAILQQQNLDPDGDNEWMFASWD